MAIREVELPGIGTKYTVDTQAKEQVVIVLHRTGKREIYHFAAGQASPSDVIELTANEAQQIGGILGQTVFESGPARELVMKELTIEWLPLPARHLLTEKSIRTMEIRQRTGASIIAILRAGKAVINPNPDEVLHGDDTLMVIGNVEQVQRFKDTFHLPAPETA
ncbi:MAG: cation:proton antiporter regulatory subunit [Candidatus Binatia bacterium]